MERASANHKATKIVIVGGGPVGLMTSILLAEYGRRTATRFDIHVYERRWTLDERKRVVWKSWMDNNNRREQTVTLQSNVYSLLPKHVKMALFPPTKKGEAYVEMWALGPDSPEHNGYPRNIKIKRVEDVLLDLVQNPSSYEARLGLDPPPPSQKPYKPPNLHLVEKHLPKKAFIDANFVILADGGAMTTEKKMFPGVFGERQPFSEDPDLMLAETVLGIYVENEKGDAIGLSEAETVLMTSAQNRFLLNPLGRKSGFLNMWLTPEEAAVAVGFDLTEYGVVQCNQANPCSFRRCADGEFRSALDTKVTFWPSVASQAPEREDSAGAMLWNRILDGLKLYNIKVSDVKSFTTFRLGPYKQRMSFVKDLTKSVVNGRLDLPVHVSPRRPPYAAVIGDAAFPVSFRAGRGLNTGLKASLSLSFSITAAAGRVNGWRMADFTKHEGFMSALQMREVACRSLQMMETQTGDMHFERVVDRLQDGINDKCSDADEAREALYRGLERTSNRIADRLPVSPPRLDKLRKRLYCVSDETARVLFGAGPWNATVVGGTELGPSEVLDEPLWSSPEAVLSYNDRHLTQRKLGIPGLTNDSNLNPQKSSKTKKVGVTFRLPRRLLGRSSNENVVTTDDLPPGSFYEL